VLQILGRVTYEINENNFLSITIKEYTMDLNTFSESNSTAVFCTDKVKKLVENSNFTGITFTKASTV